MCRLWETDTITRRIARLLAKDIPSDKNVAFTFTEKAAEEMKFRIRKHLIELRPDNPELGDMYVGTVHSFCFELLKNYYPKYKNYDVLDDHTRVLFLKQYKNFHEIGLDLLGKESYKAVSKFCFNVDVIREEMLDPNDLPKELKYSYDKYIEIPEREKFMDFSGMMYQVLRLLNEDKGFRKNVQEKYQYVTVDEYQDINPIQEKIISSMVGPDCNLCVVGDDDQCIYQWRGTNVESILTFEKRYSKQRVHKEDITINFRSSESVVNSAKNVIERNKRLEKAITTWDKGHIKSEPGDIFKVFFPKWEEEVKWTIEKVNALRGRRYVNNKGEEFSLDYRDMVVFFRSVKTSAEPVIKAFKDAGIPFIVKGGGLLFDASEIELVLMAFHFLSGLKYSPPHSYSISDSVEVTAKLLFAKYQEVFGSEGNPDFFVEELEDKRESVGQDDFISIQKLFHLIVKYMGATERSFPETVLYNPGRFSQVISDFETIYGANVRFKQIKYFFGYIIF
ncbi:MAG: ATP-dependent helicase [Candidatus Methanoperedens sp.]|nr:ATP-dependent helicase [Candidatus Methanoperedens sp.]MCE8426822.1 ATP-dependent helicase [Candidatus Methanoperedens sp.]